MSDESEPNPVEELASELLGAALAVGALVRSPRRDACKEFEAHKRLCTVCMRLSEQLDPKQELHPCRS